MLPSGFSSCLQAPARGQFPAFRRRADFRGQNVETPPYPSMRSISRFGTVSGRNHSQAIPRLSWLSYSRPGDLPPVPDSGQRVGSHVSPRRKLPTGAKLSGPFWPEPLGRDLQLCCSPALNRHGLPQPKTEIRLFSVAPAQRGSSILERGRFRVPVFNHRVEHRDYSKAEHRLRAERHRSTLSTRITPTSPRRTGRAPLDAPSSTSRPVTGG